MKLLLEVEMVKERKWPVASFLLLLTRLLDREELPQGGSGPLAAPDGEIVGKWWTV